jgi:hypothetical protein
MQGAIASDLAFPNPYPNPAGLSINQMFFSGVAPNANDTGFVSFL